jgi:hypothetical protein
MLCPRRSELPSTYPLLAAIPEDRYELVICQPDGTPYPTTIVNYGEPACTWCGSLEPDRFMELIRQGVAMSSTTKSYKVYLLSSDSQETWNGKFYFQHLSVEQRVEFVRLYNAGALTFAYDGHFTVLPFFMKRADRP